MVSLSSRINGFMHPETNEVLPITNEIKAKSDKVLVGDMVIPARENSTYKAYMPDFLWKPPFGYPRGIDVGEIRRLAQTPYCEMAKGVIIDEVCSVKWDIVPEEANANESHIREVKYFFKNPNANYENLKYIFKQSLRDILDLDAGLWNKVFNRGGRLTELYAKDGGQFTINPDMYGTFRDKKDFIPINPISLNSNGINQLDVNTSTYLRDNAAYFQYAMLGGGRMVPFGKREIVYMKRNPLSNSVYGWSPMQSLKEVLNSLIYAIQHNKDQFTDDTIPKGVVQLTGATTEDINAFKIQWNGQMKKKNRYGEWVKNFFKIPIVGTDAKFIRLGWSNDELQLITQQQWYSKLVWGCLGVPPSELGFTENSNRATETGQKKVIRRRTVLPLLDLIEYSINSQIVPEFGYDDVKFQFDRHDNEEELEKTEIYEKQINAGFRTINEIRIERGDKPIEGGDDMKQKNTFNPFEKFGKKEDPKKKEDSETKSIEAEAELFSTLKKILNISKKEMYALLEKSASSSRILEMKTLDNSQIDNLTKLLELGALEKTIKKVIYGQFMKGIDEAEVEMDRNFIPDTNAIAYLQNYTFSNIKDLDEEMKNKLRGALQRGIMDGNSVPQLKKKISEVLDVGEVRLLAIARTETMRASNSGKLNGYKQSELKGNKVYVAKIDNKTSDFCRHVNGMEVPFDKPFTYKGESHLIPPAHVNCRSTFYFKPE